MFEINSDIQDIVVKLSASLLAGLIIGAEREYRNKSAGLRTIILITLGSTIFTIISLQSSHETEVGRIASNIVTGIGFLGAGAIMRDGFTVSGLTTASTIWVTAAIGMAIGVGQMEMAIYSLVLVMIVLVAFNALQRQLDKWHKEMNLSIVYEIDKNDIEGIESKMENLKLRFSRIKECRKKGDVRYVYRLSGNSKALTKLIDYLVSKREKVKSFHY